MSARKNYQSNSSTGLDHNQSFGVGSSLNYVPQNFNDENNLNFDIFAKNYNSNDRVDRAPRYHQPSFGLPLEKEQSLKLRTLRIPLKSPSQPKKSSVTHARLNINHTGQCQ